MTVSLSNLSPDTISDREFVTVVRFASEWLGIPDHIDLNFEFEQVEDYKGFVHQTDCGNNEFIIVLSPSLSWEELVKTIIHEMVHVRQFVRKQRTGDVWMGVPVKVYETDYHNLPWEVEAFRLEEALFDQYVCPFLKEAS